MSRDQISYSLFNPKGKKEDGQERNYTNMCRLHTGLFSGGGRGGNVKTMATFKMSTVTYTSEVS